jgi:hypothetical protein
LITDDAKDNNILEAVNRGKTMTAQILQFPGKFRKLSAWDEQLTVPGPHVGDLMIVAHGPQAGCFVRVLSFSQKGTAAFCRLYGFQNPLAHFAPPSFGTDTYNLSDLRRV